MQAAEPQQPTIRFYNALVGHLIGIGVAFGCAWLLQASEEPSVLAQEVMPPLRLDASVLAIALVVLLQLLTRSLHPPAAAIVLLITLGGFQMTRSAVVALLVGVTMIAVAGELVRWLRLKQPRQS